MFVSLLPFLVFAFVASATPGPNNVMVFSAAATHGLRATIPLILGIGLGFGVLVAVVGSGLAGPLTRYPPLYTVLRWLGAAWLLLLAWKIARAGSKSLPTKAASRAPMGFWGGSAFQWVNPKAWILALATTAIYTVPGPNLYAQVCVLALIFVLISVPCVGMWAILGLGVSRFLESPARLRIFNFLMGALLAASVIPVIWDR
jgi:threonine/homoserine/homoserine lactone efflux protein